MTAPLFDVRTWVQVQNNTAKLPPADSRNYIVRTWVKSKKPLLKQALIECQGYQMLHLPRIIKAICYFNNTKLLRHTDSSWATCENVFKNEDVLETEKEVE